MSSTQRSSLQKPSAKGFEQSFIESLGDVEKLEALYRQDRSGFARALATLDPAIAPPGMLAFWNARLSWKPARDSASLLVLLGLGLACWLPLRIFLAFPMDAYTLIGTWFPGISLFCWGLASWLSGVDRPAPRDILLLFVLAVLPGIILHFYPWAHGSQTQVQALFHSLLLAWAALPLIRHRRSARFSLQVSTHLALSGETLVWTALFLSGGALLTGLTLWFLASLGLDAGDFYGNNIVSLGCVMAPFLALHFARPGARFRLSDTLFSIFAPLAALTMFVFLIAGLMTLDKLFETRETFSVYALVPVAAMAVMILAGTRENPGRMNLWSSLALGTGTAAFLVMVLVPGVYRILTWGLTPNKLVVLSISLLLLVQTVFLSTAWIRTLAGKGSPSLIPRTIAGFLPAWALWAGLVVAVLPLVFRFS